MKDIQFRFSLAIMNDNYEALIIEQINTLQTHHLNIESDDVSTLIEGNIDVVFNALHQLIANLSNQNIHFNLNGMFTVNCPVTKISQNKKNHTQALDKLSNPYVSSQFYLFPMGSSDYIDIIMKMIEPAKELGLINPAMTKATGIHGNLNDVLDYYKYVLNEAKTHTFMQINMSINSPSHE